MAKQFLTPINLNKNELQNARTQNLASAPASPAVGQFYYDTVLVSEMQWDGTAWRIKDPLKIADGSLPIAKLVTNPLARSNHTGTQTASTISDLAATVQAYRLDQFAQPTAAINLNGQKFTNGGAPTAGSNDLARIIDVENAVQSAAAGIDSKPSVRALANTNITLTGTQTIDGVAVIAGDRVLVRGQSTGSQNGVYVVAAGAWSRATDADATGEVTPGAFWFVEEGTGYGGSQWRCANTGTITLGTTSITISQFGATSNYTNGDGLTLTGNVFAVGQGTGIVSSGTTVSIDTAVVARKGSATIGDGSATAFVVTHNFNNLDVVTQVREVATNNVVEVDIQNTSVNTVTLSFASAPAAGAYRVSVTG